jgi:hypothetical protein
VSFPPSGSVRWRVIVVQVVILAGLLVWFKVYLPSRDRARAAGEAAAREKKIEEVFRSLVVEDPSRQVRQPGLNGGAPVHPQKLRAVVSRAEVEQILGVPQTSTSDFRGGEHLVWIGTEHKLEAAFDKGRLYSLRIEDLRTGHGSMVFEQSWYWQTF